MMYSSFIINSKFGKVSANDRKNLQHISVTPTQMPYNLNSPLYTVLSVCIIEWFNFVSSVTGKEAVHPRTDHEDPPEE
jgi:hypothetical protein